MSQDTGKRLGQPPLCKDCDHSRKSIFGWSLSKCMANADVIDLIDGSIGPPSHPRYCSTSRSFDDLDKQCGKQGKFFEPTTRPAWLKFLGL